MLWNGVAMAAALLRPFAPVGVAPAPARAIAVGVVAAATYGRIGDSCCCSAGAGAAAAAAAAPANGDHVAADGDHAVGAAVRHRLGGVYPASIMLGAFAPVDAA